MRQQKDAIESQKLKAIINWLLRDKYPDFLKHPKKCLPGIEKDIEKLKRGEPLAYVVGWVDFLDAKIDLSQKPLIPRPETEFWVEQVLKNFTLHASRSTFHVLDLCAGSGCIGLAVLKHAPNSKVVFADSEPNCLRQVRKNLKINKVPPFRYAIKHSDILKNVGVLFDCILTNPPYVPSGRKLPDSVRRFEPRQALFAGRDGLSFLRKILKEAPRHLKPGGAIYFEFDSTQKRNLETILKKIPYASWDLRKDQYGKWRYGFARTRNSAGR